MRYESSSEDDYGSEIWDLTEDDIPQYNVKPNFSGNENSQESSGSSYLVADPDSSEDRREQTQLQRAVVEEEEDKLSVSSSVLLSYLKLLHESQPPIVFQRAIEQGYDDEGHQASAEDDDAGKESKPSKRRKLA